MVMQPNMSKYYNMSTPNSTGQEWPLPRHQYSPPRDIDQYASRLLPPQPMSSSPTGNPEEDDPLQHTPRYFVPVNDDDRDNVLGGVVVEETSKMVQLTQVEWPDQTKSGEHPGVVSPRPRRPDSKLLSTWSNGDELVSPIDTPGMVGWDSYIVSPLSESSQNGASSSPYESWFDDASSDEEERQGTPTQTQHQRQTTDIALTGVFQSPIRNIDRRYSDPSSALSTGGDNLWLGEPGPDVGGLHRFDDASGRQTVPPQAYGWPGHDGTMQSPPQGRSTSVEASELSFEVSETGMISANRPHANRRPVPPPLNLGEQSFREDSTETAFPPRTSSASSQRSVFRNDGPSAKLQKRRSRLGNFGSSLTPNRQKPPPGFTEMFSQLDKRGAVSPVPGVKSVLSKARRGLGMSSDESKKEQG